MKLGYWTRVAIYYCRQIVRIALPSVRIAQFGRDLQKRNEDEVAFADMGMRKSKLAAAQADIAH